MCAYLLLAFNIGARLRLSCIYMDRLTLCMISAEFIPVWGGTGSYTVELIKHLPRNLDIHVATLNRSIRDMVDSKFVNNDVNSIIDRPIKIHYLAAAKETFFYNLAFQVACWGKIPRLHDKYKFDIIHSHLPHTGDIFFQLVNKNRVPTVVTVHSTITSHKNSTLLSSSRFSDLEWSEKFSLLSFPIIRLLHRNYVKRIARFIAVSNITKELIIKHLNVEAEKISVVYNGVDTGLFHSTTPEELEKKFSRPTVVYIGRIMAKKGLHVLIKAMSDVIRCIPQTKFLFVGGGNISAFQRIIEERGIPRKNYSFIGHVSYFECPKILREATVFVNPSFFENCSLSILEAMSCNTAVVASQVGGNPEIIESGKNGILVPPSNNTLLAKSIISLLGDENYNKKLGVEARRTVEKNFSSKRTAEETYEIYKEIVQ